MPRRKQTNVKTKQWCFTLNNFGVDDVLFLRSEGRSLEHLSYLIFGRETGEEGTRHLQGYVAFTNRKRLSTVKKLLPRAHWEKTKGTAKEASEYCKKDRDFEEFGELPRGQGNRSDLDTIRRKIESGMDEKELASEHFNQWVQYRRSFVEYRRLCLPRRTMPPQVFVLEGETGVGKTRFASDIGISRGGYWISCDPTLRWFDGYCGQKVVIIDDFDGRGVNFRFILRLLDRYELDVPVKGGFTRWAPEVIFITTNIPIEQWFPDVNVSPLRRRVRWEHIRGYIAPMTWEDYFTQIKNKLGL